jgi:hypothetical protein
MAISRRNKRKIVVDGQEYLWWAAYDWGHYMGGGAAALHICTPDRRLWVSLSIGGSGRRSLARVQASEGFLRGPVERGAVLRCEVTQRDTVIMPGDVRALIDWCKTPGPVVVYKEPPEWPPAAPEVSVESAVWPLVRHLRTTSLGWSSAVCDAAEQPLAGSPLLLHTARGAQLELWARGDLLAASRGCCALERRPHEDVEALDADAVWLMNPAPLARLVNQSLVVAAMYVSDRGCHVVVLAPGRSAGGSLWIEAAEDRLVVHDAAPAVCAGLRYMNDMV